MTVNPARYFFHAAARWIFSASLMFAGAMAVSALPMFSVDTTTLLLAACIAAGVLLVVAGIVATLSRTRR